MKSILFLVFILWALPLAVTAQNNEPWSLQACIDYALENNIQVKRHKLAVSSSENTLRQSKLEPLPNVNTWMTHKLSSGKSVNYETYEYVNQSFQDGNLGVQSQVDLFNGLENVNTIKKNKFNLMADLQNLEKFKNDIILNISTAYLQILFSKELLTIAEAQMEVTQLQVEKTQKLVEVGNLAQGELLEIRAQLARDKLTRVTRNNDLINARLSLVQLLDLDSVSGFDVIVPDEMEENMNNILFSVDYTFREAMNNLPDIKQAEFSLKSSEKQVDIASAGLYPSLSVAGVLYSRYSELGADPLNTGAEYPYTDQLNDNLYKQVSLNLNIPVFNKWRVRTNIDNARLGVVDSKLALEQTKKDLYQVIQKAHTDAVAALEKYYSTQEAVKSYDEAYNYVEQKFNVGLVNSIDLNIAKNNLQQARSEMLQAKYEYIFKSKILDFYTGKSITL